MRKLPLLLLFVSSLVLGSNGHPGTSGRDGRDGYPGRNLILTADGTPQRVDLTGSDGEDGSHGGPGGSAFCSADESANGGDGGRGGNGGNGGSGGELGIYYSDSGYLKNIQAYTEPGYGGRGGYGGSGGMGCGPSGRSGSSGWSGRDGSNGGYGPLVLINQLDPLKPTDKQVQFKMDEMEKAPFQVSANNWEIRTGARSLLAAGSRISNSYYHFLGRTEFNYQFEWKARKPLLDFKNRVMALTLDKGQALVWVPSNIWFTSHETVVGDTTVFTFDVAFFDSELFNFAVTSGSGVGADLAYQITDKNALSDLVETTVHVDFFTRNGNTYYHRFHADMPPEMLTINADKIDVAVGKLAIDPKYLVAGTQTMVQFNVKRSLGKKAATKIVSFKYAVK